MLLKQVSLLFKQKLLSLPKKEKAKFKKSRYSIEKYRQGIHKIYTDSKTIKTFIILWTEITILENTLPNIWA